MRQIRPDPAGFGGGSYGVAFILGGTSTTAATAGNGYAVVLGQSLSTDPVRLAKYTTGLQGTLTNIITSNTTGLTDFGAEYLSVKVTYNPANDQWELFLRNDGASAFADPTSGTLTSQGTATDNTYTGVSLTTMGGYWQGATAANQTAFFDNVTVKTGVDGTIASGEYGTHTDGQNQQTSGGSVWYMSWDNVHLYIGLSNADISQGAVIYIDKDPQTPINGGTNANGTNVGQNYDGTSFAALQFRAELVVYFKNGYREYRTADGSNGWSAATTAFGSYADDGGTNTRELSIPWSVLGELPSSFAWFGYVTSSGGFVYASVPTENAGGSIGTGARYERYYMVSTTTVGSETKPFSRNSFVFNNSADESGFGTISVYDFTMNSAGRTITRGSGVWTISGNFRVDAGTVSFGSTTDAASVTGNAVITGTLTLSSSIGGDLNVGGNWTNDAGTFNANSRTVQFNGTTSQTITGATTFAYLEINNSSGVSLNDAIAVNNELRFTTGNLTLGSNNLTFGSSATVTGANAGKCIITNGTGKVVRAIAASSSFQFPIGATTSSYNPLTISLLTGDPTETFSVGVSPLTNTSPGFGTTDTSMAAWRVWDISEATLGGNNAQLTFQWDNNDDGSNIGPPTLLGAYRYNSGSGRYNLIDNLTGPGGNPIVATSSPAHIITSFSSWIAGNSAALPVQLASFTGVLTTGNRVRLEWRTMSELNNFGFYVEKRRPGISAWTEIPNSFIAGHGTTSVPRQYTYTDAVPIIAATEYRLRQVDLDGTEHFSEPIVVDLPTSVDISAPREFVLSQNYPNPFNPTTEIRFSVAEPGPARLVVYNSIGQEVGTLFNNVAEPGRLYDVRFTANGLSSGIYFYRLTSGKHSDLKKLMLLK